MVSTLRLRRPAMSKEQATGSLAAQNGAVRTNDATFFTLGLQPLGEEVVKGVRDIAKKVLGKDDQKSVRSMYHVLARSNTIPSFKIGSQTCVQMSSVRAKFWSQEKRAWAENPEQELLVKTHLLLTSALPLLIDLGSKQIGEHDLRRLIGMTSEAVPVLQQLLHNGHP
jgi:hypothetical protein